LFPVLALGELIKRDTAANVQAVSTHTPGYLIVTSAFVVGWLVTVPLWQGFLRSVVGVAEAEVVFGLSLLSVGFYVLFAFNNVADSVFYGRGKTDLMLYQSLIVNTLFYGGAFVLYRIGVFVPSLTKIVVMFGVGIGLDSVIKSAMFAPFRRRAAATVSGRMPPPRAAV